MREGIVCTNLKEKVDGCDSACTNLSVFTERHKIDLFVALSFTSVKVAPWLVYSTRSQDLIYTMLCDIIHSKKKNLRILVLRTYKMLL